jgi:hypothetical protein
VDYLGLVPYQDIKKANQRLACCLCGTYIAEALPVSWIEAMAGKADPV